MTYKEFVKHMDNETCLYKPNKGNYYIFAQIGNEYKRVTIRKDFAEKYLRSQMFVWYRYTGYTKRYRKRVTNPYYVPIGYMVLSFY